MSSKNPGRRNQNTGKRRKVQERESSESKEDVAQASQDSSESEEREEIADPFSGRKGFYGRAKILAARDWVKVCRSFADRVDEVMEASNELALERFCEPCRVQTPRVMSPVDDSLAMSTYGLQEYSRWYLRALREVNTERVEKEGLASENKEKEARLKKLVEEKREAEMERDQLREEREISRKRLAEAKQEVKSGREQLRVALAMRENTEEELRRLTEEKMEAEREIDQLRSALTAREEKEGVRGEGTCPPPLHTEPEEVEMREGTSPPPSGEVMVPAILEALEKWFQAKWDQMASHWPPPSTNEGVERSATPNRTGSNWAGVVGRRAGERPSSAGMANPQHPGKRGADARPSPATRRGAQGPPRAEPPGSKRTGKKKSWPTLPESAVVAIGPVPGGVQTGAELIREARQTLSLEEMEIPPLEIKRRWGDTSLALRAREQKKRQTD